MGEKKGFENFVMVTTPLLDGVPIKEYLGTVVVRNVRAANIVRNFLTMFRNVVGGRSQSYQDVIDEMYREVFIEMRRQAELRGATAIIGLRLDFETVGHPGMLFMATGQGTAVRI